MGRVERAVKLRAGRSSSEAKTMYRYMNASTAFFILASIAAASNGNVFFTIASTKRESSTSGWTVPFWMYVTASHGRSVSISHVWENEERSGRERDNRLSDRVEACPYERRSTAAAMAV